MYVKWTDCNDEPPGWYKAQIDQYYLDGTCKIIYDDKDDHVVYEIVELKKVEWKPCSKRARKFVPLHGNPVIGKSNWKQSPKFANSMKHSLKGYADDVTLISNDIDAHTLVLQTIDEKAADLDLFFKPVKCVSYLFNGSRILPTGISLSNGVTRSIFNRGRDQVLRKIDQCIFECHQESCR